TTAGASHSPQPLVQCPAAGVFGVAGHSNGGRRGRGKCFLAGICRTHCRGSVCTSSRCKKLALLQEIVECRLETLYARKTGYFNPGPEKSRRAVELPRLVDSACATCLPQ